MRRFLSFHKDAHCALDATTSGDAPRLCDAEQLSKRSAISSAASTRNSRDSKGSNRCLATLNSSVQTVRYDPFKVPTITKTPWEEARHKKVSTALHYQGKSRQLDIIAPSINVFTKLPRDIYDFILEELELLHFQPGKHVCPSCHMRDISSLALTSRAWDKAARTKLYRNVHIIPDDGNHEMKKMRLPNTRRIKLLRRTLREQVGLARIVRELNCHNYQDIYRKADIMDKVEIVDMIASAVMACPNLEKLTGLHISYDHNFDKLSQALSTRKKLTERVWLLKTPSNETARRDNGSDSASELYNPMDLTETFLSQHSFWPSLTTIILHNESPQTTTTMTFRGFIAAFRSLPALSSLSLSCFSAIEFTNLTLSCLPILRSLRLEHLPGVTDAGLQRYFARPEAVSITNLSLINLQITDLAVLRKIFEKLIDLLRLTICQTPTPRPSAEAWPLPASTDAVFRAGNLEYLHWSCLTPHPPTIIALAKAIQDGDLPSLRTLRAPTDDGTLQAVCAPRASISKPGDEALLSLTHDADSLRQSCDKASILMRPTLPPTLTRKPDLKAKMKRKSTLDLRCRPSEPAPDSPRRSLTLDSKGKWKRKRISTPAPTSSISSFALRPEPKTPMSPPMSTPSAKINYISLSSARLAAQHRLVAARKSPGITVILTAPSGVVVKTWIMGSYLGLIGSPVRYSLEPDIHIEGEEVVVPGVAELVGVEKKGGRWKEGKQTTWERVRVRGCLHPGDRGGEQVTVKALF